MNIYNLKKAIFSIYLICILIIIGLIGLFGFEGVIDDTGVQAASTLYVGSGQAYTTVQDAIDVANKGDTVRVFAGIYYENVIVNKSVTLIGSGTSKTKIDGGGISNVIVVIADWVNISGFHLINSRLDSSYAGININNLKNCNISNNNLSYNRNGILLTYSQNISIYNNEIIDNDFQGIRVENSNHVSIIQNNIDLNERTGIALNWAHNNSVINNNITSTNYGGLTIQESDDNEIINNRILSNAWNGFYLGACDRNKIHKNNISSNDGSGIYILDSSKLNNISHNIIKLNAWRGILHYCSNNKIVNNHIENGIFIRGKYVKIHNNTIQKNGIYIEYPGKFDKLYYDSHEISNNTVDGKPIYYFKDMNNIETPIDAGSVIFASCDNTMVDDFKFNGIEIGIQIAYSNMFFINNSKFSNNGYGLDFIESTHNRVLNCDFNGNTFGINFNSNCNENLVENCEFNQNYYGLYSFKASNNNINYNNIFKNTHSGIFDYLSNNIDAINNWWGADSGPYHFSKNPNGKGDKVEGYADFSPWLNNKLLFNKGPTIQGLDNKTIQEDEYYYVSYTATDPENDLLNWSFESNANWLNWGSVNHTLFGRPTNADVDIYYVFINVSDPYGKTDSHNFDLEVINTDPIIITGDIKEAIEDIEFFNDYNSTDDGFGIITWCLSTNATWLNMDTNNGTLSGTPRNNDVGAYWINVNVSDGNGGFDEHNFSIVVSNTNDAPEVNHTISKLSFSEDTIYDSLNLNDCFYDVDGDELVFRCEGNECIKVDILVNGIVLLEPEEHWNGKVIVTFFANDSIIETPNNIEINVLPVNDPPFDSKISISPIIYYEGQYQPAFGNATNVDQRNGDEFNYSWSSNISGFIGYGQKVNLSQRDGYHTITLRVTDNENEFSTTSILIEIKEVPYTENGNGKNKEENNDNKYSLNTGFILMAIGLVIVIVIIIVILVVVFKKRKKAEQDVIINLSLTRGTVNLAKVQQISEEIVKSKQELIQKGITTSTLPTQEKTIIIDQSPDQKPIENDVCFTCGKQLFYISQAGKYYCYSCKKYE